MRIKKLHLKNFRGIADLTFEFHESVSTLVGVNGSGKSSILDCAAILLSKLTSAISTTKPGGRQFVPDDIRNGENTATGWIQVEHDGSLFDWTVTKTRAGRPHETTSELGGAKDIAQHIQQMLEANNNAPVPLAVFYPVNRAVLDIPVRIREKHTFDQIAAHYGALTGAQNNFRLFFEWFREREDVENEEYRRKWQSSLVPRNEANVPGDRQLEAVRQAIPHFLPGFANLHVQRQPHRMVINKGREELIVNQLSDGEKCTLALVGDLARRLALAYPELDNPLQAPGIVLIDEIDLHLHPGWQRRVVPALQHAFPRCQFILTTHSPQVVSEVPAQQIWVLDAKAQKWEHPHGAYGLDSNRILEDVMDVPERPQEVKEKLASLFRQIDLNELPQARQGIDTLRSEIGDDPELTKAAVLIRRKEVLGK
jgi:predicted ATP-binding protein involved in virulence